MKTTLIKTLPVMAGYIFLGTAFGILAESQGLPFWITVLMSTVIYAGAGQFAAVPILVHPISLVQTFILTLSINARHLFYGITMLVPFSKAGNKKHYMTFALTDESFSIIINEDDTNLMFNILLFNQIYWIIGTIFGFCFGQLFPLPLDGVEFAMTALFLIIFIDKFKEGYHFASLSGLFISLICLVLFGGQYFIIPSMILILISLKIGGPQ